MNYRVEIVKSEIEKFCQENSYLQINLTQKYFLKTIKATNIINNMSDGNWTRYEQQMSKTPVQNGSSQKLINNTSDIKQQQILEQRYQESHLEKLQAYSDLSGSKKQWSKQQEDLVFILHNQFGNKWAIIAERLKGRTDNCIKNHFYSRLRKGLRKINKTIEDQYKKIFKQFKIIDLYKVIEASDQKFKEVKIFTNQMSDIGYHLKNRLFLFAQEQGEQTQQYKDKVRKLLEDLTQFCKSYKRKSKKSRRYSPMGVDSVYRMNSKKGVQDPQTEQYQPQKIEQESAQKEVQQKYEQKVKVEEVENKVKIEQEVQRREIRTREAKQKARISQKEKEKVLSSSTTKKQTAPENTQDNAPNLKKTKTKNNYRNFSDDQDQQKHQTQYMREQRLNHFAQNILKTFKSYYSFQSFKSQSAMEEPFFQ